MTEPEPQPSPPVSPASAPERYPFWSYLDLAIFLSLALPCLMIAALFIKAVLLVGAFRPPPKVLELLPTQFLGYGLWFGALYVWLKVRYGRPFWRSLGWMEPPRPLGRYAAGGALLAISVVLLGLALRTPNIDMPIKELLADRLSVLLVGLFAITLGPLFEELMFRGFLLPLLVRSLGVAAGVILTALPFALLHGPQYAWSWRHLLLITLAGVGFGWVRWRSGSTLAATVAHAAYNAMFFLTLLAQKETLSG